MQVSLVYRLIKGYQSLWYYILNSSQKARRTHMIDKNSLVVY